MLPHYFLLQTDRQTPDGCIMLTTMDVAGMITYACYQS